MGCVGEGEMGEGHASEKQHHLPWNSISHRGQPWMLRRGAEKKTIAEQFFSALLLAIGNSETKAISSRLGLTAIDRPRREKLCMTPSGFKYRDIPILLAVLPPQPASCSA